VKLYGRFIATPSSYKVQHVYLDVNGEEEDMYEETFPAKVGDHVDNVHQMAQSGYNTPLYQSITVKA
jgi:hypothetical protein